MWYLIFNTRKRNKIPKEKQAVPHKRERLALLHYIKTDYTEYYVYETQTLPGVDCVNIEIEASNRGRRQLILQQAIFEDSWGAMGGVAFSGLIIDAVNHLYSFIEVHGERIVEDKMLVKYK